MNTRSPVAIGTGVPRAISAIRACFWQLIGSSTNIGWSGSSPRMSRFAVAGLAFPWKSMAMSMSSPAAFRSAANGSTANVTWAGVSMYRGYLRRNSGSVLNAVNPAAIPCRNSAGVRTAA